MSIVIAIGAFMIVLLVNLNIVTSQMKEVQKMDKSLAGSLVKQNIVELLSNPSVVDRLFLNHILSDGPAVNNGPNNKGVRCLVDFKNNGAAGTIPCEHNRVPSSSFGTPCDSWGSRDGKTLCWIRENLADHAVDVIFHPNPAKSTTLDILLDNRTAQKGVSPDFKVCDEFSPTSGAGNSATCPFQMRIYLWVECEGGALTCGGGGAPTINGTIKMAAIPIPHGDIKPFNTTKYSILDFEVGSL